MNVKQMLLTPNKYSRPQYNIKMVKAIVIHWVANPKSSAIANRNFFENRKNGNSNYGSSHYIIDLNGEIIQCIPDSEQCVGVGSKTYTKECLAKLSLHPNDCTISIECTHLDLDGTMTKETYNSLIELCVFLCKKYNLEPSILPSDGGIWTHKEVVGWKDCHKWFVNNPDKWIDFKKQVLDLINVQSNERINVKNQAHKQLTFEESLKVISEKIDTNYDFWLKKQNIDPYFKALIIKIGNSNLNKLTKDDIGKFVSYEQSIKILSDKLGISYDYWILKKSIDKSFQFFTVKCAKAMM